MNKEQFANAYAAEQAARVRAERRERIATAKADSRRLAGVDE